MAGFDFEALTQNPMFTMGMGLLGGANPRNAPLLNAMQMLQAQQKFKTEQEYRKAQMEQYAAQTAAYKRKVEKDIEQQEFLRSVVGNEFGLNRQPQGMQQPQQQSMQVPIPQAPPQFTGGNEDLTNGPVSTPIQQAQLPQGAPVAPPPSLFDSADKFVARIEGGAKKDPITGQVTDLYGINRRAHPNFFKAGADQSPEAAQAIRRQYWNQIGADQMEPKLALVAYDTAINHGLGFLQGVMERTGGNPTLIMQERLNEYRRLAKQPRFAKELAGWEDRIKQLRSELETFKAPTAPEPVAQQQGDPFADYRSAQRRAGAVRLLTGDVGGMSDLANAREPKTLSPGQTVVGPNGEVFTVPEAPSTVRNAESAARNAAVNEATEARQLEKEARERRVGIAKSRSQFNSIQDSLDAAKKSIDDLITDKGLPSITGANAYTNFLAVKGGDAYRALAKLKSIQSKLVNDTLQSVRAASANGASGYGQFTVKELEVIQTYIENLDPGRPDFVEALRNAQSRLDQIIRRNAELFEDETGRSSLNDQLPAGAKLLGLADDGSGRMVYGLPDGRKVTVK